MGFWIIQEKTNLLPYIRQGGTYHLISKPKERSLIRLKCSICNTDNDVIKALSQSYGIQRL